jgi:hypothetical protein
LETIALHEIGHLSGLGHSALGETELLGGSRSVLAVGSVMFPIAFPAGTVSNRALFDDDLAGISDLYPDAGFAEETGTISGRVTIGGEAVFGAHIVAFSSGTGAMIGGFSLDEGRFVIAGLAPGPYVLRVEPLDDAETDSFIEGEVDVGFRPAFFRRLVVVPAGHDSGATDIAVTPK